MVSACIATSAGSVGVALCGIRPNSAWINHAWKAKDAMIIEEIDGLTGVETA